MSGTGVCVGICTATRSNADDGSERRNPLGWTLSSLAAQDVDISRVVILKHGDISAGFNDVVQQFASTLPMEVESFDRSVPLGDLRNRLLETAEDQLLYILDDDAIPITARTLPMQVARFTAADPSLVALQGPVLRRTTQPRIVERDALHVGIVDASTGEVTFRFDSAISAKAEAPLVDIDHLCLAQSLLHAARLRDVGGFTTFSWPALYGQESELGVRLVDSGHRVAFLPAPDAAVVHLKFGAPHWTSSPVQDAVLPGDVRYSWAAELAAAPPDCSDQGWSRKSSAGFFTDYVSGFGAVFARRGQDGLERFLRNTARRFVVENRLHHPFVLPIEPCTERAAAFDEGLDRLTAAGLWRHERDFLSDVGRDDMSRTDDAIWI